MPAPPPCWPPTHGLVFLLLTPELFLLSNRVYLWVFLDEYGYVLGVLMNQGLGLM